MFPGNRHRARCVIGVPVGDQHIPKRCFVCIERASKVFEMTGLANAGVDQDADALVDQEIGMVARSGHRTRIVRLQPDGIECRHRS